MSAYRTGERIELCAQCGEAGAAACLRCGAPLCRAHAPSSHRRCDACEAGYLARESARVRQVVVPLVILVCAVTSAGAFGTHMARNGFITGEAAHLVPLAHALAVLLFGLVFGCPPLVRRILRSRFLAERRSPSSR